MIEMLWQYDRATPQKAAPATASQAEQALVNGNRAFADLLRRADDGATGVREVVQLAAHNLGLAAAAGECPAQTPFAAVLGCADARVPVEMIWW